MITGGRAPVALELARLLHETGCTIYVAESAEYHLCRVSAVVEASFTVPPPRREPLAYIAELESLIERWQIDLLVPMCEEIFYIANFLERLGRHCRVLSDSLELLGQLHHKYRFIEMAEAYGLPVPDTRLVTSREEWLQAWGRKDAGVPVVLKPAYSRFAARVVMPRENGNAAGGGLPAPPEDISPTLPWVAQQYIRGKAICTYSVVYKGTVVAHAAYESRYRTGRAGASVHFEQLYHQTAFQWVSRFAAATGFSGQTGFDFIETEEGMLYPIECNPRATSGIHLFGSGDGLAEAILNPERLAEAGRTVTPMPGNQAMLALPMLGCGLNLITRPGQWLAWWRALCGAADVVCRPYDRKPWAEQLRIVAAAWKHSNNTGLSMTEALTEDIEWNGGG